MNGRRLGCFGRIAAALALAGTALPGLLAQASSSVAGRWTGEITLPSFALGFSVALTPGANGAWSGTMDIPVEHLSGGSLTEVTVAGNQVHFTLPVPGAAAEFSGVLENATIAGTMSQRGHTYPFALHRPAPAAAKAPPPYRGQGVTFYDGPARLAGTLTRPDGITSAPAVVLIAGSGPMDRNETLPWGFQPLLELADFLSRHGFAVLRYDKRGIGQSTGDAATATTEDYAQDAEAAADFLRRQPGIDHQAIGLIGHSEGGEIAPMVAARDPKIAFIVLLGGPGQNGSTILKEQYAMAAEGADPATIPVDREMIDRAYALAQAGGSFASLRPLLDKLAAMQLRAHGITKSREVAEAQAEAFRQMNSPWMRFFLVHDPAAVLRRVRCPVLVLAGSRDQEVPPGPNLAVIRAALTAGHNRDFKVLELPGLNHLFQNSSTGAASEYASLPPNLSPQLYHALLPWLQAQARAAGASGTGERSGG